MYDSAALAHWHRQFAWQANLNHALHETEQRAKRVSAVEQHDVFAAAVLAREWLSSVQGLGAGQFHDLHAKRAVTEALEYLHRAAHPGAALESDIAAYFTRMDHLARFRRIAGEDPAAFVANARAAYDRQGNGWLWLIGVIPCLLLAFILVVSPKPTTGGAIFFLVVGAPFVIALTNARQKKAALERELREREEVGHNFQAFMSSPDGYPWLQRMWLEHRLLFETAPRAPVSGRMSAPAQVVIERQVVVARCRFCRQLTPVDRPTCEHCGAAGYGSSQA